MFKKPHKFLIFCGLLNITFTYDSLTAKHALKVFKSLYYGYDWSLTVWCMYSLSKGSLQKKNCLFWDNVSIDFTRPPLKPKWDNFNWDNFSSCWPLPPVFAIETYYYFILNQYFSISQNQLYLRQFFLKTEGTPL